MVEQKKKKKTKQVCGGEEARLRTEKRNRDKKK